jgi:competence protein ComEC
VIGAYAVLWTCVWLGLRAAERRRGLDPGGGRLLRPRLAIAAALFALAVLAAGPVLLRSRGAAAAGAADLRVSILDVGQGDAILLRPPGADPVLVDGGPPGDDLARLLADHGVERLGAALLTHEQSDHAGGILDILGRVPIGALDYAEAGPVLLGEATAAGAQPQRLAAGDELRFGELRLDVLWPPRNLLTEEPMDAAHLDQAGIDPNRLCLVVLAEWRHFSILLTGDAEEELAPVQPGPVDVLKVAHHGSVDSGLDSLLDGAVPDLAVISVGAGNPYGHPTPETVATLSEHGVPILRTDEDGTVEVEAAADSWSYRSPG